MMLKAKEVVDNKIKWLMKSSCTFFLTNKIEVSLFNWFDEETNSTIFEFIIITYNENGNVIEVV